jgi:hypothetical protein
MYNFILQQWIMIKIGEVNVRSYVPKWINEAQANIIIGTPQVTQ